MLAAAHTGFRDQCADNILAGGVDHHEGHSRRSFGVFHSSGHSSCGATCSSCSSTSSCCSCSSWRLKPGLAPGSSPGRTHPRQAVRPGAPQDDLAAVVHCCCPRRCRRSHFGCCSTQAAPALGLVDSCVGVLVHVVCLNVTRPLYIIIESLFMRFGTTTPHTRACELTQIKCPIFGHNFGGY